MSEQAKTHIFSMWLAGELNPDQQLQFEQFCIDDKDFAQRVAQANSLSNLAESDSSWLPPEWNKEASFSFEKRPSWWQWQGLPVASLALSTCAIIMVMTGFNVHIGDDRISIGFGQQFPEQQVTQIVQRKLDDYQQTNQAMFAQYVDAIQSQQQQSSTQLTEYLLSSSRKERREDFAELIKFINEQRADDQFFYARQLNNLQQEIYTQNDIRTQGPTVVPSSTLLPND